MGKGEKVDSRAGAGVRVSLELVYRVLPFYASSFSFLHFWSSWPVGSREGQMSGESVAADY